MLKVFGVFLIAGLIPVASFSSSQQADDGTRLPVLEPIVQLTPTQQRIHYLESTFPDTKLKKHTSRPDAERYLFQHEGKPLKLTCYVEGQFKIQWTREFSSRDIDELADAHPDLLKFAMSAPESTDNQAKVKVKIETEVIYHFDNELEWEREQPVLYAIYLGFKVPTEPG